ncbi:hypothetical protein PYW08_008462 [Mythimna loreyi]|uniref:Uncharacterized protein n=1 Tax=Mythimna loreyi TaxID=667449 RepID=A0ACC2QE60_9NEOP|nr:hypothetical protein PYW08_008462 [Mythimna loreyi]
MNSKEDYFPRLEPNPGEGMLPRKRFHNLQMEANVFQQATNLLPPLDPPQPPSNPAQPPAENEIVESLKYARIDSMKNKLAVPKISPNYEAQKNPHKDGYKDDNPEIQMC